MNQVSMRRRQLPLQLSDRHLLISEHPFESADLLTISVDIVAEIVDLASRLLDLEPGLLNLSPLLVSRRTGRLLLLIDHPELTFDDRHHRRHQCATPGSASIFVG